MTEKRSRTLWESGVRLNEAWLHFANSEDRARHNSLKTGFETFADKAQPGETEGGWIGLLSAMGAAKSASQAKSNSEENLKSNLLDRFFDGEFELLGFRMEPTKSRTPVIVAASELEAYEPDWTTETIQIRDELYVDLRVSPADRRPTGVKRGRPGSTDRIRREIELLISDPSKDLCGIERKAALELIRQSLKSKGVDTEQKGMGLSLQNVSKLLLEKCPKRKLK